MKDLEKNLKDLVEIYAELDKEEYVYKNRQTITAEQKQTIEANLIAQFSHYLSQDGLEEAAIDIHQEELRIMFDSDKLPVSSPEIKWLESTLNEGSIDNYTCFKLVELCASDLKNPKKSFTTKGIETYDSLDSLIESLVKARRHSKTLTQRALLDGVIQMLTQAKEYDITATKVNSNWAQSLIKKIPYITSVYCVSFCIEEIALVYAVSLTLSMGGRLMKRSDSAICKMIGEKIQVFSSVIAEAVTAFLARLIELNIFVLRNVLSLGFNVHGLLAGPSAEPIPSSPSACTTLALRPQALLGGVEFNSFELKIVALSLEHRIQRLGHQWFLEWRLGGQKKNVIQDALKQLVQLDQEDSDRDVKLAKAERILTRLASNKTINIPASKTTLAIEQARETLKTLRESQAAEEEKQLLLCY